MSSRNHLPWSRRGVQVFKEGDKYYGFAHIGWGDTDTEFFLYMRGFKNGADQLVDMATASKDIAQLDTLVFPILFLYRQYLELALKHIYLTFSQDRNKKTVFGRIGHDLAKAWALVEPLLLEGVTDEEAQDVKTVGKYIAEFYHEDSTSFTFRYPITKHLEPTLHGERRIDLVNLKDRMRELEVFLTGCTDWLDSLRQEPLV